MFKKIIITNFREILQMSFMFFKGTWMMKDVCKKPRK